MNILLTLEDAGATVPIIGFGYSLANGVINSNR